MASLNPPRFSAQGLAEHPRPGARGGRRGGFSDWVLGEIGDRRLRSPEEERLHAEELARQAEMNRQAKLAQARAEGHVAGLEQGRREAREALASAVAAAEAALEALREEQEEWRERVEKDLAVLAAGIARHLLGQELQARPEAVAERVRSALNTFPLDQKVRIRLHPSDIARISAGDGEDRAPIAAGREVRWIPDPSVEPGGCLLEGTDRILDGRLEETLARIVRSMTDG